ncbi:hypothetical protein [Nocardia macrotermitis]|uniref:N-acetyltransferase domain-containing protein n=1 Tax=Nocardia macrotermitis TaxID=2585198 RepID=A0A7K0CY68_9NOCA|nr:hypothetical protein [Nocardia macrotermitis]MQY18393.1 hypothetical protein [Nocardia macrotermitis]
MITERTEARKHPFQQFTCTEPRPKSPHGRTLPHPKPWEWTAQSILRRSSECLKAGSLLVVGRSVSSAEILAVAHVIPEASESYFSAYIAAIGVSRVARGQGGGIADRTLAEVRTVVLESARGSEAMAVLATANIHTANLSSQRLFERSGYEPRSVPSGEYQQWVCRLDA